jgi:hypothetical protein
MVCTDEVMSTTPHLRTDHQPVQFFVIQRLYGLKPACVVWLVTEYWFSSQNTHIQVKKILAHLFDQLLSKGNYMGCQTHQKYTLSTNDKTLPQSFDPLNVLDQIPHTGRD